MKKRGFTVFGNDNIIKQLSFENFFNILSHKSLTTKIKFGDRSFQISIRIYTFSNQNYILNNI